jgi:hypothetical protein
MNVKTVVLFGQNFLSNWVRRSFSNIVFKNVLCPFACEILE